MVALLQYMRCYRKYYIAIGILITFTTLLSAINPYLSKFIIDEGIISKRLNIVVGLSVLVFAIEVVAAFFDWLQSYYFGMVGQNVLRDIRSDVYNNITNKRPEFFSRHTTGDLIARLEEDVSYLEKTVTHNITTLFSDTIMTLVIAIFLIFLNYELFLFVLVVLLVVFIIQRSIGEKVSDLARQLRQSIGLITRFSFETISRMLAFQNHNREQVLKMQYASRAKKIADNNILLINIYAKSAASIRVLAAIAVGAITAFGGYQVVSGNMTLGSMISYTFYFYKVFGPIQNLARTNLDINAAQAAWSRVHELMIDDTPSRLSYCKPDFRFADIAFKNVCFGYDKDCLVLDNVTWHLPAGMIMLLQGSSGAGKTTTANLLLQHYYIDHGSINIAGIDICDIDVEWLRTHIFIVEQDPLIINGSLRDNLLLFTDREILPDEIEQALYMVCLDGLIRSWSNGIDTVIGESGMTLSNGQRQRIALARAILANPPVLILDESTSAIDLNTEQEIIRRIKGFLLARTVILITHRPAGFIPDVVVNLSDNVYTKGFGKLDHLA